MKLAFIHIGKCGGSFISETIKEKIPDFLYFHQKKPEVLDVKYIIWVRNPLSRFVSAFNYSYAILNHDFSGIKNQTVYNSLAPYFIERKKTKGYIYPPKYTDLMNYFGNANNLAEAIENKDRELRGKARSLTFHPSEHIKKGIGWHLSEEFLDNIKDKIFFVGSQENMKEDVKKLGDKLGVEFSDRKPARKNTFFTDRYLSEVAIKNLKKFYKKDYQALGVLKDLGWIDSDLLESYYTYNI
jgi:hypothetical protein